MRKMYLWFIGLFVSPCFWCRGYPCLPLVCGCCFLLFLGLFLCSLLCWLLIYVFHVKCVFTLWFWCVFHRELDLWISILLMRNHHHFLIFLLMEAYFASWNHRLNHWLSFAVIHHTYEVPSSFKWFQLFIFCQYFIFPQFLLFPFNFLVTVILIPFPHSTNLPNSVSPPLLSNPLLRLLPLLPFLPPFALPDVYPFLPSSCPPHSYTVPINYTPPWWYVP